VQNNQFGWRFFGRQLARTPAAFSIPKQKPQKTVRIFVFGESAAFGDPQPRFGLPRMIEALLSLRHPDMRFEVINAAMTGINSHAILPIAHDCARAGGDIWVIYMGNNEVIGPFGAGTVFGAQTPPLPLIRASLALKATRTGEALDSLRDWLRKKPSEKSAWGGMMMFVSQQVTQEDPRMARVYYDFERNLSDIVKAGRSCGAGIVVSTVAVNLRDCAPFASMHRRGLTEAEKSNWTELYKRGIDLQQAGAIDEAATVLERAAGIDDSFAELRFRQGLCALALGLTTQAQKHFAAARDLDCLRFRCDGRLNDLIRHAVSGRERERLRLADTEKKFSEQSAAGSPGNELFYEHVHLTFAGNYLVARTITGQIEELLRPGGPSAPILQSSSTPAGAWPSQADCARRLAWTDWNQHAALSDIFGRLQDPPFTKQMNHAEQVQRLNTRLEQLTPAITPSGIRDALELTQNALASAPDDPFLCEQAASLKLAAGDLQGAAASAQKAIGLVPRDADGWLQLGSILAQQGKFEEAASAFRAAFELDPENAFALQYLAQALNRLGRADEAIAEYRRAVKIQPRLGTAWLGLGQALQAKGRMTEADECYREALTNRIHRATELTVLARFCQSRGWSAAAATNYDDAIKLNPADAQLRIEAGQALQAAGLEADAGRHYAAAARLAPDVVQARFLYGLYLARASNAEAAVTQFREAVRIMPALVEARLNLGIALMSLGKNSEALEEFEEALKLNPTNAIALKNAQLLRADRPVRAGK